MDYKQTEKKWREKWQNERLYAFDKSKTDKKCYVLEMFSYPSGSNLHVGHWYNFAPADTFARFKRMQGFNVFQPMGFDAFGLPAENYAIKTGVHPKDSTLKNIKIMEEQLANIGAMYEPDSWLTTCDPSYYKWTQWLFLQLYKAGLAYQKQAPVNFCTSCQTTIANEQVKDGKCERCDSDVVRKNMSQWFFKITSYADELLDCLDGLDWPEKTKAMQRNWIGKSVGAEISFPLENGQKIDVFTTRPDTLMGVSYVVLAPEHPLADSLTTKAQKAAVEKYQAETSKLSDVDRTSDKGGKTGVFTGAYCTHPITQKKLPVWLADYCLYSYGTGAVMGVPAHDTRDFDFAKKYGLSITRVIGKDEELPFVGGGMLTNSGEFDGLTNEQAKQKIVAALESKNSGFARINYRLRDWSVSRQRYWGCPIPIIHCEDCGAVAVPEKDLPVTLPYDVNFAPSSQSKSTSPLAAHEGFMNCTCPKCGKKARREADTLDTFVCSSWYFLRYPDSKNTKAAFDSKLINKMLPVDKYIGGAEHACMHLLYSRFFTKTLRDMGYLSFDEPFKSLVHQGLILGADGEKMSKSKGNVENPDKYTAEYGSDVMRMYLMFAFSYVEGGPWSSDGIKAIAKFLDRAERLFTRTNDKPHASNNSLNKELLYALNYAIKQITSDLESLSFNTGIARLMELVNALNKYAGEPHDEQLLQSCLSVFLRLLAPFAPHFAEEINESLGGKFSVFNLSFPVCEEKYLVRDEIEIAAQVNSKIITKLVIAAGLSDGEITAAALSDEKIQEALGGKSVKKSIVVKGRLVNLIV